MRTRLTTTAAFVACLSFTAQGLATRSAAAQGAGYFIPPAAAPQHAPAQPRTPRTARRLPVASAPLPPPIDQAADQPQQDEQGGQQQPLPPLPHPPVPNLAALPKANPPPPVIVGILSVPDVMRGSNADQIIQRIVGARKEKLRADVDRAQASWRTAYQQLQAEAPHMTPEQGHAKERALRARIESERRGLQERYRVIAEAGQVALNQIESTLLAVVKQVAESRGMNVVMHRAQVALNMPEFDITDQVTAQLNKLQPTVQIPAENVDPASLPKDWANNAVPPSIPATPAATPAAAPATH
jgi:Skp family chaperone for outer membrane proteins